MSTDHDLPIVIIGAGFGGIGMAIRLKQAGIDSFRILERASQIGGTWRDNTYPGAACDVPSHVYSLSFELNPDWSQTYSGWAEIQRYLLSLVEKWGLAEHLSLNTSVQQARFDESAGEWQLTCTNGEVRRARVVVGATGGLVDPKLPAIEGLKDFRGPMFHTARWDHNCELGGKRVGVIGTGASAIQVVPSIAEDVRSLSVFQRSAAWVVPRGNRTYSSWAKLLFRKVPGLLRLSRWLKYALSEIQGPIVFLGSRMVSRVGVFLSTTHLRRQVSDPELRKKLRPTYLFGCKRVLVSDDYWPTFERDNVELVTAPITRVTSEGVETQGGERRALDALILATGFDVGLTSAPFPVYGIGGMSLDEAWKDGAQAYKGMSVSGFPNFFILMGPNTGPGHTSVLVYTEAQLNHILGAIRRLRVDGLKYVDVRKEVMSRYNRGIQKRMPRTAWMSGCNSWYLGESGINRALYPGFAAEYVLRARRFVRSDYRLVPF